MDTSNQFCITQVASTMLSLLDIEPGEKMAKPIDSVLSCAKEKFGSQKCDRIIMYNPDAIALWIYERFQNDYFVTLDKITDLKLPMLSVFPPVTPACFGSMYSGLQPVEHGIQSYTKPVLKCETVFDKLIAAGKKVAIVSTKGDSISLIFLERKMDYFIFKTVEECNSEAFRLLSRDKYDVIVIYNNDYDYWMHRCSPTGIFARHALKKDLEEFLIYKEKIQSEWSNKHHTALAFAPDHGCHRWLGLLGTHGKNEPCDMNTIHYWTFI